MTTDTSAQPDGAGLGSASGAIAQSFELLEMLLSKAPIGLGFVDRELRRVWVNETLASYNDMTVAEQIGRRVPDLVPTLWPQMEPCYRKVLDHGEAVIDAEVSGPNEVTPDVIRHWRNSHYPVWHNGEVVGVGIVALDITELKNAVQANRHLATIVENSGEAIFSSSPDGIATTWNAAAEQLFGYTAAEIIGRPLSVLAPPEREFEQQDLRERVLGDRATDRRETVRRRKDGTLVDVLITASPSTDENGAVIGVAVIAQDITERRQAQDALTASQRRLAEAQRIARIGSYDIDLVTGAITWSDELRRIIGVDASVPPSLETVFSMVHPDDKPKLVEGPKGALEHGIAYDVVYRMYRGDGELCWVHARGVPEPPVPGAVVRLAGTIEDITAQVETERIRREAETRFEVAFEQAGVGAAIINLDGVRSRVNAAACEILGRPKEQLVDRSWDEYHHPDERELMMSLRAQGAGSNATYNDERRYLRPDGTIVWVEMHIAVVRDEAGEAQYYLAQFQDITGRKKFEVDLAHMALHDSLTGLANRALLTDRLTHSLATARRHDAPLAVIFLDLDQFKIVNDSLGHGIGDDLLKRVAARVSSAIRTSDTVARFGGDEFVVICADASVTEVELVAQRVLQAVSQPYLIHEREITVTASLGIAVADPDATTESLLRDCDTAMYSAKRLGRDRIELFDASLRANAEQRMATATALRGALKLEEFVVYYQPIVELSTGRLVSAEALLRWNHPQLGLVGPDEFIPVAEETGVIGQIGAWVLERACCQLVEWQRHDPCLSVAVNLSVRQILATDIVGTVGDIFARSRVRPDAVHLELTESVLMGDTEYFEKTLTGLKGLGAQLAIDDFGTGYSSLSYLHRFPVDSVKIDRAFVDGLGVDRHNSALVAAIMGMAEALELSVTAEGIETVGQLEILKQLGCELGQGFYLARPMTAAGLSRLVGRRYEI